MAFGNYLTLDDAGAPVFACEANLLLRPSGAGGYPTATPLAPGWCTLSLLFSDWDRSGRADLRVANDRHYYRDGGEQLWRIAPGEAPRLFTEEEGWRLLQIWGMGLASQDLTGDGRPEVVITSQGDNKLQTLDDDASGPSYRDIAIKRGVTAHRPFIGDAVLPSTAWHPEFQDVNNDGFVDLYISKGNVDAMVEYAAEDPSNLLLGHADGSFVEAAEAAGILSFGRGRGAALADFNLDGMLDLVEINRRENVKVWRNIGWGEPAAPAPMGNWIAVRPAQTGPNRDAIGSWLEVKVGDRLVQRELTVGGGHAGGQVGWIHFGLGNSRSAEIRIQWPDGETGPWHSVGANTFVIIDRDAAEVQIWSPVEALTGG
ncbi:MAG: CRTAC1 family protein [Actinomycetota bacterium]